MLLKTFVDAIKCYFRVALADAEGWKSTPQYFVLRNITLHTTTQGSQCVVQPPATNNRFSLTRIIGRARLTLMLSFQRNLSLAPTFRSRTLSAMAMGSFPSYDKI